MQRLDVSRSSEMGATVWRRRAPWGKQTPPAVRSIGDILLLTLGLLTLGATSGSFHADWFDPRTGVLTPIGTLPGGETHTLTPPSGEDWLVLLRRL